MLKDGRVSVAGGFDPSRGGELPNCEIYDPATGTWTTTGAMNQARYGKRAALLENGKVLIVGGAVGPWGSHHPLSSAELYDPETETWTQLPDMSVARLAPAVVVLADGTVLVTGGNDGVRGVSITEIFNPEKMDPERIASLQSELMKTRNRLRFLGAATFTLLLVLVGTSVTISNKKGPKEGHYRNTQLKGEEKR